MVKLENSEGDELVEAEEGILKWSFLEYVVEFKRRCPLGSLQKCSSCGGVDTCWDHRADLVSSHLISLSSLGSPLIHRFFIGCRWVTGKAPKRASHSLSLSHCLSGSYSQHFGRHRFSAFRSLFRHFFDFPGNLFSSCMNAFVVPVTPFAPSPAFLGTLSNHRHSLP